MRDPIDTISLGDALIRSLRSGHIKTAQIPLVMLPAPGGNLGQLPGVQGAEKDKEKGKSSDTFSSLLKWAAIIGALYLGAMALKRITGLPSLRFNLPSTADPQENFEKLMAQPTWPLTMSDIIESKHLPRGKGLTLHLDPSKLIL